MGELGKPFGQHYRSTTASAVPLAANLGDGEIALNTADKKIFFKDNLGAVHSFLGNVSNDAQLKIASNLLDLNDIVAARFHLGLGSLAEKNSISGSDWSGTDLGVINGGTGASDAATARTNLGAASSAITVSASNGLTGGGDLTTNRTISGVNASTSVKGVVQLSSLTNSTSTSLAATASAVKAAYDLANAAATQEKTTFTGTGGITNGTFHIARSGKVVAMSWEPFSISYPASSSIGNVPLAYRPSTNVAIAFNAADDLVFLIRVSIHGTISFEAKIVNTDAVGVFIPSSAREGCISWPVWG